MKQNFITGFAAGLVIFILINALAAHLASDCGLFAVFGLDSCADDIARAGWPLQFYEEGGFAFRSHFDAFILFVNLAIGAGFSIIFGWLYALIKKTLPK